MTTPNSPFRLACTILLALIGLSHASLSVSDNYSIAVSAVAPIGTSASSSSYLLTFPTMERSTGSAQSSNTIARVGFLASALGNSEIISGIPIVELEALVDQMAVHGNVTAFYVACSNLSGPLTYTFRLTSDTATNAQGQLLLDSTSGLFRYSPSTNDLESFNIVFTATSTNGTTFETEVAILPYPVLPNEEDPLPPGRPRPEPDSTDYLVRSEIRSESVTNFNGIPRTVRDVQLSGAREVIIRYGHPNGIHLYDGNSDIRSLIINAEVIRFEVPLTLSNTVVTLNADRIEFVGVSNILGATIITNQTLDAWFTPAVCRMYLAYVSDLYLNGYTDDTKALLQLTTDRISVLKCLTGHDSPVAVPPIEYKQMAGEIDKLLLQVATHRDFFGNPVGYAPLLSFEVLFALYEADIEPSLRTWFLTYWLSGRAQTVTDKLQALTTARGTLAAEIDGLQIELLDTQSDIEDLRTRGAALETELASLNTQLNDRIRSLQEAVQKKKKKNQWRQILNTIGTVARVIPIPIVQTVGTGLQFISQIGASEPVGIDPFVNRVLTTLQSPLLQQGVGEFRMCAEQFDSSNPNNNISTILQSIVVCSTNVSQGISHVREAWEEAGVRTADIEKQLQDAKAQAPELNSDGLIDRISGKTKELQEIGSEIATKITRLAEIKDTIYRDLLAVDALNRNVSQGNAVLDHRALTYIKDMEHRTKIRLRHYHYLVAKAYEYRLLQPYSGELDVEALVTKMIQIATAGSHNTAEGLTSQEFGLLRGVYDDLLSTIVANVVSQVSFRNVLPGSYRLNSEELGRFNSGESLVINLLKKCQLDLTWEDIRLTGIRVTNVVVSDPLRRPNSSMSIRADHSNIHKLRSFEHDYIFQGTVPLYWSARYFANDRSIAPSAVAPSTLSLLWFLLGRAGYAHSTNLILFSLPSASSDLTLTKSVQGTLMGDVNATDLTINYDVEFNQLSSTRGVLEVFPSSPDLRPVFQLNKTDRRGRRHGIGRFYRTYQAPTVVQVTAPRTYGAWRFVKWVDCSGFDRPNATNRTISVTVGSSGQSLQAVYENTDVDEDGMSDDWERQNTGGIAFDSFDDPNHDGSVLLNEFLSDSTNVLPPPRVVFSPRLQVVGTNVTLSIIAAEHHRYMLQGSTNLVHWQDLSEFSGSEQPLAIADRAIGNRPYRFYRAKRTGFALH